MYEKKKKGLSTKFCVTLLALALVLGCAVGGTLAWLTAQTDTVVNTFTVGDIEIDLWEPKYDPETNRMDENQPVKSNTYKIVPGIVLPKNPLIEMKAGSEPCWLFMKMEKKNVIEGITLSTVYRWWNKLENEDDVYYIEYTPDNEDVSKYFDKNGLANNVDIPFFGKQWQAITVSGDITKEDMATINANGSMELNFTAYAVQHEGFATAADAWKVIKDTYLTTTTE